MNRAVVKIEFHDFFCYIWAMMLTRSFVKSLTPCVVACMQALAAPGVSAEPPAPLDQPAVVQVAANSYDTQNSQLSYLEWKKRLQDARTETIIGCYQAAVMNAQPVAGALYPRPA